MFSRLKGFINRHKKKLIVTSIIIGGGVITYRYIHRKLLEFQEKQAKEFIEKTKRLNHFESTERTCNQAIVGLNSNLYNEITQLLNLNHILDKLRTKAENKIELWENLKIIAFTRLITLVYASSMLVVTLRVQLNLLGGYLYKDTISEEAKVSDEIRQSYLSLIEHFLTDGLQELIQLIKDKVKEVLTSHPLDEKLSLADIEQIFWSIQMSINNDNKDPNSKISTYVLPKTVKQTGLLQQMFNETLDILETEEVAILCLNNVSRGFSIVVDNIAEYYSEAKTNGTSGENDLNKTTMKTDLNNVVDVNKVKLPLAKVIPIINTITSMACDINGVNGMPQSLANSLVTFFLVSEKVKTLGANVYEVFST